MIAEKLVLDLSLHTAMTQARLQAHYARVSLVLRDVFWIPMSPEDVARTLGTDEQNLDYTDLSLAYTVAHRDYLNHDEDRAIQRAYDALVETQAYRDLTDREPDDEAAWKASITDATGTDNPVLIDLIWTMIRTLPETAGTAALAWLRDRT